MRNSEMFFKHDYDYVIAFSDLLTAKSKRPLFLPGTLTLGQT